MITTPLFLNQHKAVRELVLCLDNDPAGRDAAVSLARKYADRGYRTRFELPQGKDFNEDLQGFRRDVREQKRTQLRYNDINI